MDLIHIRLPRQLEADAAADAIRRILSVRTVKIWPGGEMEVPVIALSDSLGTALRKARGRNLIRCGFEDVSAKLENERRGIAKVQEREGSEKSERISRLVLFSNDCAGRLYRHIEQLLTASAPRVLGCLLDIDSAALGHVITGKESRIKVIMAEHKEAVSDILRAIAE